MRFYSFNFNELDILPSQDSDATPSQLERSIQLANDSLAADITRKCTASSRSGVFDGEVLSQVWNPFCSKGIFHSHQSRSTLRIFSPTS